MRALSISAMLVLALVGCGREEPSDESANVVPQDEVQRRAEAARNRLAQNKGGRRVLRAIEAHGGLEAWYRAPTSSYTWAYANKGGRPPLQVVPRRRQPPP